MHLLRTAVRPFVLAVFTNVLATTLAAEPPRPWPDEGFLPVTEQRIAALPADEQTAWRAYLSASAEYTKLLPSRDLVDHSATKRLAGPPIGASYSKGVRLKEPAAWYATEEARAIADHVVGWQTPAGGWVKGGDYSRAPLPTDEHHDAWSGGTFDNDSTIYEMRYLALVNAAAEDTPRSQAWRKAFLRGLSYILQAQYPNGGFPQIYPLAGGYHDAITFNDDAMVHILELLRDVGRGQAEFAFVTSMQVMPVHVGLSKGISCILAAQLKTTEGRRTVWCQQHDALTLQPCAARNFEPMAECSLESAGLVRFLMTVPNPSPEIIAAIDGAMAWFPARALHGVTWNRDATTGTGLEPKADAPDLWARFYEIGTGKPVFGERNRMIHYNVTELTLERRKGYGWYNTVPNALARPYAAWKKALPTGK